MMRIGCLGLFLGIACCATPVAAQQTQALRSFAPQPRAQAPAKNRFPRIPARLNQAATLRASAAPAPVASRPANPRLPWVRSAATRRPSFQPPAVLAPLRIASDRSSFLSEARLPLADAWGGRLRLAGVQQRFHAANLYSTLAPASLAEVAVAPGAASLVGRPRVNYGVGLQLRF